MKALDVPDAVLEQIHRHADQEYPEECCGFLLGDADSADAPVRRIRARLPAENRSDGERRRRFVIVPEELRRAEESAAKDGAVVAGFYHSHPDHPARPSGFDQEHAWPWYAYVIVGASRRGGGGPVGAFELDPDRREFHEVPLVAGGPRIAGVGSGLR